MYYVKYLQLRKNIVQKFYPIDGTPIPKINLNDNNITKNIVAKSEDIEVRHVARGKKNEKR